MQFVKDKMSHYYPLGVYKDGAAGEDATGMTTEFILAGFGGQGILFAGKILAYCGLMAGKELSLAAVLWPGNAWRYGKLFGMYFR